MSRTIKIFTDTNEIAEEIAGMIIDLLENTIDDEIHIALSGGNTPKAVFNYLNEKYGASLASPSLHFWWGDERCVPANHAESNFYWANELWLKPIGIPIDNIHRIIGENKPEEEAIRYADEMKEYLPIENNIPRFDLIILGLGEDGHTASIFPYQMDLLQSETWCSVATHPTSGQKRITLTGKVLNNACNVVFLATGSGKADVVYQILKYSNAAFPAAHINPNHGELIWMLDSEAASAIKK